MIGVYLRRDTFEFLKALPENGLDCLTSLYDKIWNSGNVPDSWGNILLRMLYKKGDVKDPSNYRPVALVKTVTKGFTQALTERLSKWVESNNLLPEHQAGFRRKRSCADHIFTLNSVIQIRLSQSKGKLFVLFVDFRSAFPSVSHSLLWEKLYKLGTGSKIIRVLKNLYDKATVAVKGVNGISEATRVTRGVLQGEVMSPILFCLFIADFEEFLRLEGIRGVSIDQLTEIILLAFADDIALLADSKSTMRKILKALYKYCKLNHLEINIDKTKIIIFRKGGHSHDKNVGSFLYGDSEKIEVVSNYTYLGIPFSNSAVFVNATNTMLSKANLAQFKTISLIKKMKLSCWSSIEKLFKSMALSVLFYNVHIWGLRYGNQIEKFQTQFYKRILQLPFNTPGYAVRLETGNRKLIAIGFKLALNFIEKILDMDSDRYPQKCFLKLKRLAENNNVISKYNWCAQIGEIFKTINKFYEWENLTLASLKINKVRWVKEYESFLYTEDITRLGVSQSLQLLLYLSLNGNSQQYFKFCLPMKYLSIIAQMRLFNIFQAKIRINNNFYNWKCEGFCGGCGLLVNGEFGYHVLVECGYHDEERKKFICDTEDESSKSTSIFEIFNNPQSDSIKKLYYFIESIVTKRENIV